MAVAKRAFSTTGSLRRRRRLDPVRPVAGRDLRHSRVRAAPLAPLFGLSIGDLAKEGLEFGRYAGLGWIKGRVIHLAPKDVTLKIPHTGWNSLKVARPHALLARVGNEAFVYFVHSYHLEADEPADVLAIADHGQNVTAMVARGNIAGTRSTPKRARPGGLTLLANFLRWQP